MINEIHIDQNLIDKIRKRDQKTLAVIYKEVYPMVLKHITLNNGSEEDAQDIFQDAYYILLQKVDDANFVLTSQLNTFLVGISKKLWLKNITKNTVNPELYKEEILFNEKYADDADEEKLNKVRNLSDGISLLGEPCKTLLIQYYYFKQTMKEIAALLNYTNAENAKNQKYKCLQRLKKLVSKTDE